ncbi:hypothetical protein BAUCODRAFT_22007 [Baudoinia panamericana UAMH 10762]|uniref:SCA7 domain-containing protein n=1 Tax=Baudoinia panamericana (strain UAMH 10762) TaxID=717646 RepID=M2NH26_BAUPA|nr:uncharacterized protein BAUCODRAFT_22007 [Baudoinia panamericana UAMH 10762]EMC98629.1 hypothetical protein BAUCODRAFT_22007 [Baudoinia panamericana UAMH 10762]
MAPNGATARKTPAPPKPIKTEQSDGISLGSLFDDLENTQPDVKDDVRTALPVLDKPGSWESKVVGATVGKKRNDAADRSGSPPFNKIPANLAKAFPSGKLMADRPDVLKCTHCKRPVLKHAMAGHVERCLNKKQEKQRKKKEAKDARDAAARKERGGGDSDAEGEEDGAGKGKTAAGKGEGLVASKKRKAVDEAEEGVGGSTKKKKKKEQEKAKAPRPKAPVDVEKQCGVELPQGGQCARSLTCKSHSMGAKRAVPGRSAPYDKLLMEYQRKNQAKLQKAAFDANAPDPDDDSLPTGPIDSDEEKDAIMAAIGRSWGGAPLYEPQPVPLRRKYEINRFRSMLASAMGTRTGGGILGGGGAVGGGNFFTGMAAPPSSAPNVDADGVGHARRPSVVPGARSMMAPTASSRKGSVAVAT